MSKKDKANTTVAAAKAAGAATVSGAGTFECTFVGIAAGRLQVAGEHDTKASYALASHAVVTCDGKASRGEALKAGKRIRVTTQKGNPNMVTGIEWLSRDGSFPALKTAVAQ